MPKIVVVGSLNMDLVVRTPRLPLPGETIIGREFMIAPGGKGANQTVAAAKLGATVSMVGRLGADDFGQALRENLRAAGADDAYVFAEDSAATGIAIIEVEDSSQNTIVVAPGANAHVTRADVDAARSAITTSQAVIAQLEIPLDTVLYAMQLTHQANVLTVLNPAPAQPLPTELLSLIDLLIPNEIEAALLTGIEVKDEASAEQAARKLHERGAGVIVITLEERGAIVLDERGARRIPPFRVKAIDTTAAGDAFVAALAVAHAAGRDLDTALREANAAGALAATKRGAQPSLPTRAELDEFLKRARLKLVVRKFDHWDVRHRLIHLRIQLRTLVFHFARNHCAFHFHLAQDRIQYIDETWMPPMSARSMRSTLDGIGKPASAITNASVCPNSAITRDNCGFRMPCFFIVHL